MNIFNYTIVFVHIEIRKIRLIKRSIRLYIMSTSIYKGQRPRAIARRNFNIFIHNFRTYIKLNCYIYLVHI